MAARVRHRGPDGEGLWLAPQVGLASTRLAIVELGPAGAQPMQTPDGRYTLVYNGELYNHQEFRPELEAAGARFRGRSDSETLLWLLARHGEQVLPKLNGIFGFAFWDASERSLLVARDALGVKPVYWAEGTEGRLLVASEIKALFATGEVAPRVNREDLAELFLFHFIAGEKTAFAGVQELLPGHYLRWRNGAARVAEYWNPVTAARRGNGAGANVERLRALLRSAVERQLMADVPVGIMSSGGLDSGLVTALAGGRGERTGFCFRDPAHAYDEWEAARDLSESFGVRVEEVRLEAAELPQALERAAWHYDEPLARPHHLAAYAVARAARRAGLKVLLSGEGGDEVFGGYRRYAELAADPEAAVWAHNRVAAPRVARFLRPVEPPACFRRLCGEQTAGLDGINRQLVADQRTFLQHFLQRSDRMGMAEGVEIRVPLLDLSLVEYANGLPGEAKVAAGGTKLCLKVAAEGILPPEARARPKQPFEMPMAPLLREGPLAGLLDDVLLERPRLAEILDGKGVAGVVRDFRAGQEELWKVVWLLLATELWMRAFRAAP
jgi:asparagine synthase (glutamine-hydrolysing)